MLRSWVIGLVALLTWCLPTAEAWAQPRTGLASALEAQYRAALIRERGLASSRELALINDTEARLRDARATVDAHAVLRSTLEVDLTAARAAYQRAVDAVPLRDAVLEIELQVFRAEVEGRIADASPEMIEGYRQFADGDRARAWRVLEPLLRARANARVAAARAVAAAELRQLARLREIMRVNGEATAADVLALWDASVEYDSADFGAHLGRAHMARLIGSVQRSDAALAEAARTAQTDVGRLNVAGQRGLNASARGDVAAARAQLSEALTLARRLAARTPNDLVARRDLVVALHTWSGRQLADGDLAAAGIAAEEAVALARSLVLADAASLHQSQLGQALSVFAAVQTGRADTAGARRSHSEAVEIFRRLRAADQQTVMWQMRLRIALGALARADAGNGNFVEAARSSEEGVAVSREILRTDPTNVINRGNLIDALQLHADITDGRGDARQANSLRAEALTLVRGLLAADPADAGAMRWLVMSLYGVADSHVRDGDDAAARALVTEAVQIARRLVREAPDDREAESGLSAGLNRLSAMAFRQRDYRQAIAGYTEVLAIARRRSERDPSNMVARRMIGLNLIPLGDAQIAAGERAAARVNYQEALVIYREIAQTAPDSVEYQQDLWMTMSRLAAEFPQSGVTWADLVERMTPYERVLNPSYRQLLTDARNFSRGARR